MTKEDILHHFQDINFYYNDCMMYDDLSRMLDELIAENKCFDGMTNGEVLQAVFPNISVYEHGSIYSVNNEYNFNSTWWNAPYQKRGE